MCILYYAHTVGLVVGMYGVREMQNKTLYKMVKQGENVMQATEGCSKLHAIWTEHAGVHVIVCDVLIPYFIHCLYVPGISVNSQCIETRDS